MAASALSVRLRFAPLFGSGGAAVSGGLGVGRALAGGGDEGEEGPASDFAGSIGPPGCQPRGAPEAIWDVSRRG
jgi:hypothetical protein